MIACDWPASILSSLLSSLLSDVHLKHPSHHLSIEYDKLARGEKRSLIDVMTDQAIAQKAKKEHDTDDSVKKHMRAAYWLFKYEIAHTANFERLVSLLCMYDEELCHFAQTRAITATYRSKTTVTEFLELMSNVLDTSTATLIKRSISIFHGWTLMADETSLHGESLLGVYARFIHPDSFEPIEDMIQCVSIHSTKAIDIFNSIEVVLKMRNLDTSELKCVSFDGAATMSSPINGVYGLMKSTWKLPNLVFQHCRAHRLQLVTKAVAKDSQIVSDGLFTAQALYRFFNKSNKKLQLLKGFAHELSEGKAVELVGVAPTRWLSHGNAVKRILKLYTAIIKTLDCIQYNIEYDVDDRSSALGLLNTPLSERMITTFIFLDLVLGKLNILSKLFQNQNVTLITAIAATREAIMEFSDLVCDDTRIKTITSLRVSALIDSLKAIARKSRILLYVGPIEWIGKQN